jgi:hypothetical protein
MYNKTNFLRLCEKINSDVRPMFSLRNSNGERALFF